MELYLFRNEQWERLYNCARINLDDITLAERYHPLNGTIIIGMFIIFEALYLPCMFSIYKHSEHSSYKFLFYIGVVDMLMLFIHGLESGIFNFTGYMFCSNPHFIFITASLAAGLFAMQTSGNFILALDRCTDLVSPKHSELFFSGNKCWLWIGASAIFSFYWMCFVNPGLYNGLYMNWFMNPYEGYSIKIDFNDYIHPISTYYNIFMTFAFPAIYILFIIMFLYRRSSIKAIANVRQRNWQIAMFIQVALIMGMNISSFTLFAIMQHFSINKVAILVEYYVNYFVFGFPPLIFLCCNKTIRMDTRKMFGQIFFKMAIKMYKPSTIIPNNLQSTAVNWNAIQSNISVSRSNKMVVNHVGSLVRQQRCQ